MADFKDFVKSQAKGFVDTAVNDLLGEVFQGSRDPKSGFNVENMKTSLGKSGFAKTDLFEVLITGPGDPNLSRDLSVRADTVDIPGRNLTLTEHKFNNTGPFNRIPTMQTYTDVTMTLILSEDMREKEFFEIWQNKIMDTGAFEVNERSAEFNPMTGEMQLDAQSALYNLNRSNARFMHNYFDKYVGRVEIRHYGSGGQLGAIHQLQEAYPVSIAPISLNWGEESVMRLAVSFAYRNYKVVFNKRNQPGMGSGFYFNLGKGGANFGVRLPGVGNVSYSKETGFVGNVQPAAKTIFKVLTPTPASERIGSNTIQGAEGIGSNGIPLNEFGSSIGGDVQPFNNDIIGGIV